MCGRLSGVIIKWLVICVAITCFVPALRRLSPQYYDGSEPLRPILASVKYQAHLDDICHAYNLLLESQPGLTAPPNLYQWLDIQKPNNFGSVEMQAWRAAAPKLEPLLRSGEHTFQMVKARQLLEAVLAVLMDDATRSVYDGIFWPQLMKASKAKKAGLLRQICQWE
ncbi:hypothetical protein G7046_g6194 [Stylonectria norvegica]|nr:hypothetical protein G7046_g6194 [Stylonectria norvegica]